MITECFYNTRDRNLVTLVSEKKSKDCYLTVLIIQLEIETADVMISVTKPLFSIKILIRRTGKNNGFS